MIGGPTVWWGPQSFRSQRSAFVLPSVCSAPVVCFGGLLSDGSAARTRSIPAPRRMVRRSPDWLFSNQDRGAEGNSSTRRVLASLLTRMVRRHFLLGYFLDTRGGMTFSFAWRYSHCRQEHRVRTRDTSGGAVCTFRCARLSAVFALFGARFWLLLGRSVIAERTLRRRDGCERRFRRTVRRLLQAGSCGTPARVRQSR
jgi:hypothetical protein